MRTILLIFFLSISSIPNAQQTEETVSFLENFRKEMVREKFIIDTFFYTAGIDSTILSAMKRHFVKDTLWIVEELSGSRKIKRVDSLILTKHEKDYIQKQLSDQVGNIWNDNLLEKSKLTTIDPTYRSYNKKLGRANDPTDYSRKVIFSFSRPILIRDGYFCLFFFQYTVAKEGGQIGLFKKFNGR